MSSTPESKRQQIRDLLSSHRSTFAVSPEVLEERVDEVIAAAADALPGLERQQRSEALDGALRVATGRETDGMLVKRADAFLRFLRGDADPVVRASLAGDAPDELHDALDRAWSQSEQGHGHPLHRDQSDEDDLVELLQQLGIDDLGRAVEVLQIVRATAFGVKSDR